MTVLVRMNNHQHSHMQKGKASHSTTSESLLHKTTVRGNPAHSLCTEETSGEEPILRTKRHCLHFLVIDAAIKRCSSIAFCTVDSGAFEVHSSIELNYKRFIMSKIILLAVFAMVAVTAMLAAPTEEFVNAELSEGVEAFSEQDFADPAEDHLRFRRVTCDLLSFGEYVAHSACAANCLSMGKAGGRCNNGVCQCRKTNIKDLWDKRFG